MQYFLEASVARGVRYPPRHTLARRFSGVVSAAARIDTRLLHVPRQPRPDNQVRPQVPATARAEGGGGRNATKAEGGRNARPTPPPATDRPGGERSERSAGSNGGGRRARKVPRVARAPQGRPPQAGGARREPAPTEDARHRTHPTADDPATAAHPAPAAGRGGAKCGGGRAGGARRGGDGGRRGRAERLRRHPPPAGTREGGGGRKAKGEGGGAGSDSASVGIRATVSEGA